MVRKSRGRSFLAPGAGLATVQPVQRLYGLSGTGVTFATACKSDAPSRALQGADMTAQTQWQLVVRHGHRRDLMPLKHYFDQRWGHLGPSARHGEGPLVAKGMGAPAVDGRLLCRAAWGWQDQMVVKQRWEANKSHVFGLYLLCEVEATQPVCVTPSLEEPTRKCASSRRGRQAKGRGCNGARCCSRPCLLGYAASHHRHRAGQVRTASSTCCLATGTQYRCPPVGFGTLLPVRLAARNLGMGIHAQRLCFAMS